MKVMTRNGKPCYSPFELVREFFPRASAADADFILWEMTAYPCDGTDETRKRLAELADSVRPRKRVWLRRLHRESARIYAEIDAACLAFEAAASVEAK